MRLFFLLLLQIGFDGVRFSRVGNLKILWSALGKDRMLLTRLLH